MWDWDGSGAVHTLDVAAQHFEGPAYGDGWLWFAAWEADQRIRLYRTRTDLTRADDTPGADLVGTQSFFDIGGGVGALWLTTAHAVAAEKSSEFDFTWENAWVWPRTTNGVATSPVRVAMQSLPQDGLERDAAGRPTLSGAFRLNRGLGTLTTFSGGTVTESASWPALNKGGFGAVATPTPEGELLAFPFAQNFDKGLIRPPTFAELPPLADYIDVQTAGNVSINFLFPRWP